jgi:RNA-directed DNA polymerase
MCACSSQEREAPIVLVKPRSILIVVPSIVSSNPALPEIPRDPTWPSAPDVGYPIYRLADPALAYLMEEPNRGPWVTEEADNTPEGGSYTQHGHCEIMALTIHCSPEVGQLQVDPSGVHTPWRVARLDGVIQNLDEALIHVARNKGAAGSDGLRIEDVQRDWDTSRRPLIRSLRDGTYWPGAARRKVIPRPGGGERALSIPNVVDRVVQQALRAALQPQFEPDFSDHSHGFRPKRGCHTAIRVAQAYVAEGYSIVVDIDLSKFFDHVNHQRLLARVERKVESRPVMKLLNRILQSETMMPDGLIVQSEEGVPQGGPLSPLLSNIVLDELGKELMRRGHRFVRYADDIAIFVRSERAGRRVMESVTRFIEGRMRLKVNLEKSSVRDPDTGNLLGFRLVPRPDGTVEIDLSDRTLKRAHARIRELTRRNWGGSLRSCLFRLNRYFTGSFGFFGICTKMARKRFLQLDGRARRRIRAIQLLHWQRKWVIVRTLNRMKFTKKVAETIYACHRGWWVLSGHGVVSHRLNTAWMRERGLEPLLERHIERALPMVVSVQSGRGTQLHLWNELRP